MEARNPNKSNNTPFVITIIILCAIIIGGIIFFIIYQSNNSGSNSSTSTNPEEARIVPPAVADITDDDAATVTSKDTLLGKLDCIKDQDPSADYCKIDSSKIRNARQGTTYTLTELSKEDSLESVFEKIADITIDKNDAKQIKVTFNKDVVERYYDTKGYGYTISISFDRDVASTKIAGFGQGVGDEYIFFLMKDGTLDVLRISSMLKDKNFNPYRIKGIDNIVAVLGGSEYTEYGGGHTNYAVRSDQTAYDLVSFIPSWNEDSNQ